MLVEKCLRNAFEISIKLNKIRLKELNSYISKDRVLNWFKVSRMDKFHFLFKVKGLKQI